MEGTKDDTNKQTTEARMNKGRIKGPRQRIFGLTHVWGQTGVWRLLHYPWNPVDPPTPNTPLSTPWWSWRTSGLFLFLFEDQIFIANQGPGRLLKWWMCCFNMKKSEKWASHTSHFWIISCSFSKVSQSNSSGKKPPDPTLTELVRLPLTSL